MLSFNRFDLLYNLVLTLKVGWFGWLALIFELILNVYKWLLFGGISSWFGQKILIELLFDH